MGYAILIAKDDTVVILDSSVTDYKDYVDCNTKEVKQVQYLTGQDLP